ncbi:helix-turn-helix domain-containing protein [Streptomyces sp. NPDC059071]|uniref:AraC family transcriptional regulator n=1 Tax=unclassified Streptomyces TaxID=2593676 RepID=UPI003633DBD4
MSAPMHLGTISTALTRTNARAADLLGIARDRYAGLLGMNPTHLEGNQYRTPAATNIRLWELMVNKAPWTEVAQLMTEQSIFGRLGVWDYLFTSASTPLEGLLDATEFLAAIGDTGTESMSVVQDGHEITLSHVSGADLSDDAASAVRAYALGLIRHRLNTALRKELVPVRVALATQTPRQHGALHALYGTRDIDFERPASSITFHAGDLQETVPYAQPGLSAVLRRHAEQTITDSIPLRSWLDLFRIALKNAACDDGATLAATASRLAISPRTLQRRLDEHGTTWTAEVEAIRRADITHLLSATDLPVGVIAERNGYADARALRRAVLRWTGHTPTALRRRAESCPR